MMYKRLMMHASTCRKEAEKKEDKKILIIVSVKSKWYSTHGELMQLSFIFALLSAAPLSDFCWWELFVTNRRRFSLPWRSKKIEVISNLNSRSSYKKKIKYQSNIVNTKSITRLSVRCNHISIYLFFNEASKYRILGGTH